MATRLQASYLFPSILSLVATHRSWPINTWSNKINEMPFASNHLNYSYRKMRFALLVLFYWALLSWPLFKIDCRFYTLQSRIYKGGSRPLFKIDYRLYTLQCRIYKGGTRPLFKIDYRFYTLQCIFLRNHFNYISRYKRLVFTDSSCRH